MELLTITNTNHDELTPADGARSRRDGWEHTCWDYTIKGEDSEAVFHGVYRAGTGLKYLDAEELHAAILGCLIRDIDDATEHGQSYPSVRSLIAQLSEEYGEDDPLRAYDTAVELERLSQWWHGLTVDEQSYLEEFRDED